MTAFDAYVRPVVRPTSPALARELRGARGAAWRSDHAVARRHHSRRIAAAAAGDAAPLGAGRRRDRGAVRRPALRAERLITLDIGRHQLRRGACQGGQAAHRAEGSIGPLPAAGADGRRQHDRRRRRQHRLAGRGGRAPRRAAERGGRARPGLLRAGRRPGRPSPTRASSSATSTPRISPAGRCRSTPGRRRAVAAVGGRARARRRSRPPPASTASSTRAWPTRSGWCRSSAATTPAIRLVAARRGRRGARGPRWPRCWRSRRSSFRRLPGVLSAFGLLVAASSTTKRGRCHASTTPPTSTPWSACWRELDAAGSRADARARGSRSTAVRRAFLPTCATSGQSYELEVPSRRRSAAAAVAAVAPPSTRVHERSTASPRAGRRRGGEPPRRPHVPAADAAAPAGRARARRAARRASGQAAGLLRRAGGAYRRRCTSGAVSAGAHDPGPGDRRAAGHHDRRAAG